MAQATLEQARELVDHLSPLDQARLLAYLTPRIVRVVAESQPTESPEEPALPISWQEFFRIGDEIAAEATPGSESLTAAVLAMRR